MRYEQSIERGPQMVSEFGESTKSKSTVNGQQSKVNGQTSFFSKRKRSKSVSQRSTEQPAVNCGWSKGQIPEPQLGHTNGAAVGTTHRKHRLVREVCARIRVYSLIPDTLTAITLLLRLSQNFGTPYPILALYCWDYLA